MVRAPALHPMTVPNERAGKEPCRPFFFSKLIRHPPDAGLTDAKLGAFDGFWQCQMLDAGLSCTQASDIGAPRAENADFVVIQTHLSFGF